MNQATNPDGNVWNRRVKLALAGFAVIGGFFLLLEHRAHVYPFLPWLLLAACPLMHMFMHRGHGGHGHAEHGEGDGTDREKPAPLSSDDLSRRAPGRPPAAHQHEGGAS